MKNYEKPKADLIAFLSAEAVMTMHNLTPGDESVENWDEDWDEE